MFHVLKNFRTIIPVFLIGFLVLLPQLSAGFQYTLNLKSAGDGGSDGLVTVSVDGENIKMEINKGQTDSGSFVYLGATKVMFFIDHQNRQYFKMDEASIKKLGDQMAQMMVEYNKALQSVPPQQRAMVESMMQQQMGKMMQKMPPKLPAEFAKGTDHRTINDYPTTHYQEKRGGAVVADLWLTEWENVKGSEAIIAILKAMIEFQQQLMQALSQGGLGFFGPMVNQIEDSVFAYIQEVVGFPVEVKNYKNGLLQNIYTLGSVSEMKFEKGFFGPPKGYKSQKLDMG